MVVGAELVAGGPLTEILLVVAGAGGLTGALVALVKLPGDKGTAAITQAQGANEVLQETLEAVERDRDYWKGRYEMCAAQLTQLVNELGLRDRLKD